MDPADGRQMVRTLFKPLAALLRRRAPAGSNQSWRNQTLKLGAFLAKDDQSRRRFEF
jgi:hypothetical protein